LVLLLLVAIVAALVAIGLASDDSGDGDQASAPETTRSETEAAPPPPKPARPTRVSLRVTPASPTYICVDRGVGTPVVFENTIDGTETFRGKRLRVNLGKRDVQLRMNGKSVQVTPGPDPVGFAFTPRGSRELPIGERPCA
jgi:hypothetical protein